MHSHKSSLNASLARQSVTLLLALVVACVTKPEVALGHTFVIDGSSDDMETGCPRLPFNYTTQLDSFNASHVNVSFVVTNATRLVLFDDGTPFNLTVVVRRRASVGPLCIQLSLISINFDGDPSKAPSEIGVLGLPLWVAENYTATSTLRSADDDDIIEFPFVVQLSGRRLGRSVINVTAQQQAVAQPSAVEVSGSRKFLVLVNRPKMTTFATVTMLIMMAGMAVNMLSFSVRLHTDIVRHHLRRPYAALIGICCQFILLPVISYLLGLVFDLDAHIRYALLILGCSPGGGPSNFVTMIVRGDIHLSVIMTCVSNLVSIGMMPLWLCTLGVALMRDSYSAYEIPVPWVVLVAAAVLFSAPALIGNLFRRCVTERTAIITSLVIRAVGICLVLVGFSGILYSNVWALEYMGDDWRVVVATTLYYNLGYVVSYLLAMITRRSATAKLTITIEAGFQNVTTMLLILQKTCPQPESMLSYTLVLTYFFNLVAFALVSGAAVIINDIRKWRSDEPLVIDVEPDVSPSIADCYTISAASAREKPDSGQQDSLGLRNGSFVSLTDKF